MAGVWGKRLEFKMRFFVRFCFRYGYATEICDELHLNALPAHPGDKFSGIVLANVGGSLALATDCPVSVARVCVCVLDLL